MKKLILLSFIIVSCTSSKNIKPVQSLPKSQEMEQNVVLSECLDHTGEVQACSSNEDCCLGFSCGFDPEKSRVQRYCNFSGQ